MTHNVKILCKKLILNQYFTSPVHNRKGPVRTGFLWFFVVQDHSTNILELCSISLVIGLSKNGQKIRLDQTFKHYWWMKTEVWGEYIVLISVARIFLYLLIIMLPKWELLQLPDKYSYRQNFISNNNNKYKLHSSTLNSGSECHHLIWPSIKHLGDYCLGVCNWESTRDLYDLTPEIRKSKVVWINKGSPPAILSISMAASPHSESEMVPLANDTCCRTVPIDNLRKYILIECVWLFIFFKIVVLNKYHQSTTLTFLMIEIHGMLFTFMNVAFYTIFRHANALKNFMGTKEELPTDPQCSGVIHVNQHGKDWWKLLWLVQRFEIKLIDWASVWGHGENQLRLGI